MKYLFLIIRHLFPRSKWEIVRAVELRYEMDGPAHGYKYILRDQFGNMKEFRSLQ